MGSQYSRRDRCFSLSVRILRFVNESLIIDSLIFNS